MTTIQCPHYSELIADGNRTHQVAICYQYFIDLDAWRVSIRKSDLYKETKFMLIKKSKLNNWFRMDSQDALGFPI